MNSLTSSHFTHLLLHHLISTSTFHFYIYMYTTVVYIIIIYIWLMISSVCSPLARTFISTIRWMIHLLPSSYMIVMYFSFIFCMWLAHTLLSLPGDDSSSFNFFFFVYFRLLHFISRLLSRLPSSSPDLMMPPPMLTCDILYERTILFSISTCNSLILFSISSRNSLYERSSSRYQLVTDFTNDLLPYVHVWHVFYALNGIPLTLCIDEMIDTHSTYPTPMSISYLIWLLLCTLFLFLS